MLELVYLAQLTTIIVWYVKKRRQHRPCECVHCCLNHKSTPDIQRNYTQSIGYIKGYHNITTNVASSVVVVYVHGDESRYRLSVYAQAIQSKVG